MPAPSANTNAPTFDAMLENAPPPANIVLLSCSVKELLPQVLADGADGVVSYPLTDLEFLTIIRHYLQRSGGLLTHNVYIATRDDLHVTSDRHGEVLQVRDATQVILQPSQPFTFASSASSADSDGDGDNDALEGLPSPLTASARMAKLFSGDMVRHALDARRLIADFHPHAPTLRVQPTGRTILFDLSDDAPAAPEHHAAYDALTSLYEAGRVQTSPYFLLKRACADRFGFSSSKDMAYAVCTAEPHLCVPGLVTRDVDAAAALAPAVFKAHDGSGGSGVTFAQAGTGFKSAFEAAQRRQDEEDDAAGLPPRGVVVQKFLPGVGRTGDTRVHILNGRVCLLAQRRIPKQGSLLANCGAGATFTFVLLDEDEVRVAAAFARCMRQYTPSIESSHIGLDLLRDEGVPRISEVNTWGIRFIAEMNDFFTCAHHDRVAADIHRKYLALARHYQNDKHAAPYVLATDDIADEVVGRLARNVAM